MKKNVRAPTASGFTILEVLISLFILLTVFPAIMQFMLTGDRINARRQSLSCATFLAANQVEAIRKQEESMMLLGDTAYDAEMNGRSFEVRRARVSPPLTVRPDTIIYYLEFAVTVKRKTDTIPLVDFHLLQGFYGKQTTAASAAPFSFR
jgi:type II secretory pathway pseudopilin PulG